MVERVTPSVTQAQKSGPPLEQHDILVGPKSSAKEPLPSVITNDGIVKWRKLSKGVDEQLRRRSGVDKSWDIRSKIGPEAARRIMPEERGVTKAPALAKPASFRALVGSEMCDGKRVTLKRGVAAKSDRVPRCCQVDTHDWKQ